MPLNVQFTKEDLLNRNQLEAGWYQLKIKEVLSGPGKSDPTSTTYTIKLVVANGPQAGTPLMTYLSEKAMGLAVDFVRAVVGKIEPGQSYDLESLVGRDVMGYVTYNLDRKWNEVKDWKPLNK